MSEERIVSAVAVATSSGRERAKRIEAAIVAEILKCNEEGISTAEENSPVIKQRMQEARQREIDALNEEENTRRHGSA